MHARVIPFQCKPLLLSDCVSVCRQAVLPPLVHAPGFGAALLVSQADTSAGFLLSLWNSSGALADFEPASRKAVASTLLPFLAEPPQPENYEVLVRAGHHIGGRYARVITLPIPDRHIESAREVYEADYLPLLKRQPGFQGVLWLVNRVQGSGRGISFWTGLEQMQAADREGEFFPRVLSRLAEYFTAPTRMGYYAIDAQL